MADDNDTKPSQERDAGRMADAGHAGSDTAQQAATSAAEKVRQLADTVGETVRRGSHQLADVQQKSAQEAGRDFAQSVRRMTQVLQETAEDWRALMQSPGAGGGRLQEVSVTLGNAVERVMEINLRTAEQLLRTSSTVGILELQQQFVRQYLAALLEGSAAIVQAVRQTAEQTLQPPEERTSEKKQQRHRKDGARPQAERVADVIGREVKSISPDQNGRRLRK
jgi:hypothetical protein